MLDHGLCEEVQVILRWDDRDAVSERILPAVGIAVARLLERRSPYDKRAIAARPRPERANLKRPRPMHTMQPLFSLEQ